MDWIEGGPFKAIPVGFLNRAVLILAILISHQTSAQSDFNNLNISGQSQYFFDSSGLAFEQLQAQFFSPTFDKADYRKGGQFWVKFEVTNNYNTEDFVLTVDMWEEVELFSKTEEGWKSVRTGTDVPVADRPLSLHRLISIPIILRKAQTGEYMLRLKNNSPINRYFSRQFEFLTKIEFESEKYARSKFLLNQFSVFFVLGITAFLMVVCILVYASNRNRAFLVLGLYFLGNAVLASGMQGINTNYFLKSIHGFELFLDVIVIHVVSISAAFAIKLILDIKGKDHLNYIIWGVIGLFALSLIYLLVQNQPILFIEKRIITVLAFLYVTGVATYRKVTGAFLLFILILVAGSLNIWNELMSTAVLSNTYVLSDIPNMLSILIQMIIFSIVAIQRVQMLESEMRTAMEEKNLLLADQNKRLNEEVNERTAVIERKNRELTEANLLLMKTNDEVRLQSEELRKANKLVSSMNKNLEETVKERTAKLKETLNELDLFLYRSAHDIRRPLTSILGLNNLITMEKDVETIYELNDKIVKSVEDLDKLTQKLATVGMLNQPENNKKSIRLKSIILDALNDLENVYEHEVHHDIAIEDDLRIDTNRQVFYTVIRSVLENAFMFTNNGFTKVEIWTESQYDMLIIYIKDNGIGISGDVRDKVFEMFFRGHEKSDGNGLGLYVSSKCMDFLGGSIDLKSTYGKGTIVEIRHPL